MRSTTLTHRPAGCWVPEARVVPARAVEAVGSASRGFRGPSTCFGDQALVAAFPWDAQLMQRCTGGHRRRAVPGLGRKRKFRQAQAVRVSNIEAGPVTKAPAPGGGARPRSLGASRGEQVLPRPDEARPSSRRPGLARARMPLSRGGRVAPGPVAALSRCLEADATNARCAGPAGRAPRTTCTPLPAPTAPASRCTGAGPAAARRTTPPAAAAPLHRRLRAAHPSVCCRFRGGRPPTAACW